MVAGALGKERAQLPVEVSQVPEVRAMLSDCDAHDPADVEGEGRRREPIWGFDYDFTNYNFRKKQWISRNPLEVHPSGKGFSKQSKGFSEIIVGEITLEPP